MARATGTQALSTTAVRLPNIPCNEVSLRNNDAAIAMLVGVDGTTQSYTIPATQALNLRVSNLNVFWVKSASGTPTLSYVVV